jgi:hypothetical protein
MHSLRVLCVGATSITDAGLVRLHSLTELEELRVRDTLVTAEGIAQLQRALPGCKVTWGSSYE